MHCVFIVQNHTENKPEHFVRNFRRWCQDINVVYVHTCAVVGVCTRVLLWVCARVCCWCVHTCVVGVCTTVRHAVYSDTSANE